MGGAMRVSRVQTLLKERAAASMREAIMSGAFVPRQKLIERELCEQLDVSRSCVREALTLGKRRPNQNHPAQRPRGSRHFQGEDASAKSML